MRRRCCGSGSRRPPGSTPATAFGNTRICCPVAADLDEPAGFIDGIIGGDTSGIDSAIEAAIADLEKGSEKDGDSSD